jgi:hypothetical protein
MIKLNLRQIIIMICGFLVIVMMWIYPPWAVADGSNSCTIEYGPQWDPPSPPGMIIDGCFLCISRLANQWMIVIVATSIMVYLFRNKKSYPDDRSRASG